MKCPFWKNNKLGKEAHDGELDMKKCVLSTWRETLSDVLANAGAAYRCVSKRIHQSPQENRLIRWFRDNGDKTLRLNYDLDGNSLVFDMGGYEGQWASDIFSKYCCTIHVFEPVIEFADKIEKRFSRNRKIFVHKFGLSNGSKKAAIALAQDGSSLFRQGKQTREISLVRAVDFLRENNIQNIELMKINIEGGEYDLLDHLIDTGFVRHIKNIQVQFHDFVPNAELRMTGIQQRLQETHALTYQYSFVWENWRLKDNVS
ncbi:MAG: FkbM family methyltransferase [Dehalococcoidia bacterium]|nr:FkbM family methyltransferase [Dehalococcoidia bacterium]